MQEQIKPYRPGPVYDPKTVQELVDLYLAAEAANLSPDNLANKQAVFARFVPDFGHLRPDECQPLQLATWINEHPEWQSGWTVQRVLNDIKRVFNWAVGNNLIRDNPFRSVRVPRRKIKRRGRPMRHAEYMAGLRSSAPEFRRVLMFLRFSGCRPCEMRELVWDEIDWDGGRLILGNHKTITMMRDASPRRIYLHPILIRLLRWMKRNLARSRFVFTNSKNKQWTENALSLRWASVRRRTGISTDCKMYSLRHAFGTHAVVKAIPLKVLSEMMGHTSARTTEIYIHMAENEDLMREAAAKMF